MSETTNAGALPNLEKKAKHTVLGSPTSKVKSKTNVGKLFYLLIFLGAFLLLVFGVLWFVKHKSEGEIAAKLLPQKETTQPTFVQKNQAVVSANIEETKRALKEKQKEEEQAQVDKAAMDALLAMKQNSSSQTAHNNATNYAQPKPYANEPPPLTPQQRKLSGSVLVDYATNQPATVTPAIHTSSQDISQQAVNQPPSNNENISARLQPTLLKSTIAGVLPNLDYLLKRGTTIPCALKTGINTTLAGFVICTTINDVYSANGKTLLIERGASIFGEQQYSLKQGQERVFVLWTRIDNPSGIFAYLDSPGTDQMGFNGIPGYVETHFWQRFGNAIMLSMIKDFSQIVVNKQSPNNYGTTYNNTSQVPQDMAAEALRNSINIPPTLIVNPATIVHVLVARDVSFENVYGLVD